MCGIFGIVGAERSAAEVAALLDRMAASLVHRGPDDWGTWQDSEARAGLGMTRLSILDVAGGHQPLGNEDGSIQIVFNGEIYNFRELRAELEAAGHVFRSQTDTEVILTGYDAWGGDVVDHLSGIFAFALWDRERRSLLLARDPIGVKPLFYTLEGGSLRFGSEIKAILTDPAVGRDFDDEALDAFFTFSYTPAPATGFRTVRQLLPGRVAMIDERGIRIRRYWQTPYDERPADVGFDQARATFTQAFDRVTKAQMVSDVPVGAFLSGGLDSAAIVRAMQRADAGPVHALTVGFREKSYDERSAARETAAALGVALDEQVLTLDAAELLGKLSLHMEEPTADSSMLPVYLLCQAARQRFTVAMSGDGADELLAGYDTYRATALARYYRRLPTFLRRRFIVPCVARIPIRDRKYSLHQVANRFVQGAELGPGRDHCAWRMILNDDLKHRLYACTFRHRVADHDALGRYADHLADVPPGREPLARWLHADTAFYLPNDMLTKVDRMSMAHGLEVRVPFLDKEVVRLCANLPASFKLHRGKVRKHILRESLRDTLPTSILDRPKSGFNVPVEQWMRSSLREMLFDVVNTRRDTLGAFLDLDALHRVADEHRAGRADHGHGLFTVLMFALWVDNAASAWKTPIATTRADDAGPQSCPRSAPRVSSDRQDGCHAQA